MVTNLPAKSFDYDQQSSDPFCAQKCMKLLPCARQHGKPDQAAVSGLGRRSHRTHWMASDQLRLWFSAFALLLFQRTAQLGLAGTELAEATAGTIRQRLLKIGAIGHGQHAPGLQSADFGISTSNLFAQAHRALAEWAPKKVNFISCRLN
jgi:hypothetical protein